MVLLASAYDESRFFRAEDLKEEKLLKIKGVTEEMVGQGADQSKKLVVWFSNSKKGLTLNRTNNRTIRGAYGDDTTGWTGKLIVVFPTQADFRGRMVGALRVRILLKDNPKVTTGPQGKTNQLRQKSRSRTRISISMMRSGSEQSGERGDIPLAFLICVRAWTNKATTASDLTSFAATWQNCRRRCSHYARAING